VRGTDGTIHGTVETGEGSGQFGDWEQADPTPVTTDPTFLSYTHAAGGSAWAYVGSRPIRTVAVARSPGRSSSGVT
jgi:hypothetical protein